MARFKAIAALAVLVTAPASGHADEYPFIAEALPPHLAERATAQGSQLLLADVIAPDRYFISGLKVWNTAQPIRVCFFGGPLPVRARIAQVASQWAALGGYVPLDFGSLDNPRACLISEFNQVRVGFAYKGYWSMVGSDSVNLAAQYEQSMNLALFDINPPTEPGFSRVVLHEFGHALGFQHEHQSQTSPCSTEFNWDAVYAYLEGPPNYWSKEQIDHNLRPRSEAGDVSSPFDRDSIMLYSFPASFYRTGTKAECYTPGNNAISQADIEGILRFYPADVAKQANAQKAALQAYISTVDALPDISDQAKSVAKLTAAGLRDSSSAMFQQVLPAQVPNWNWNRMAIGKTLGNWDSQFLNSDEVIQYLSPPPKL